MALGALARQRDPTRRRRQAPAHGRHEPGRDRPPRHRAGPAHLRGQYNTIYQALPDPAGISRVADGRYIEVNPRSANCWGGRANVVGRTSAELNIWATEHERTRLLETFARDGGWTN